MLSLRNQDNRARAILLLWVTLLLGVFAPLTSAEDEQVAPPADEKAPKSLIARQGSEVDPYEVPSARYAAKTTYEVSWHSIDGGGGVTSSGGDFELVGAMGQPDAGSALGADFSIVSGYVPGIKAPLGTCKLPGAIFCDGFETGGLEAWTN